jgi:hypothetical protein
MFSCITSPKVSSIEVFIGFLLGSLEVEGDPSSPNNFVVA